jgi:hypothetical protein
MTEQAISANWDAEPPQLGMQTLWRLAIWGGVATFALFVAAMSAFFSNAGSHPQTAAVAGQITTVQVSPAQGGARPGTFGGDFAPRSAETAEETRRLTEVVRALAADRDQVLSRITALEHHLDGVTGSVKQDRTPTSPPEAALPPPNPSAAVSAKPDARPEPSAAPVIEAAVPPAPALASRQSGPGATPMAASDPGDQTAAAAPNPVSVSAPAAFGGGPAGLGVDVGGAINYEGLRTLWHSTKSSDPTLLEELFPVVAVRENGKTHGAELRLVVGPIADLKGAARLCTALAAAHHYCQPVAFEGQRLSLADAAPAKAPTAAPTKSHAAPPHYSAPDPPALRIAPPAPVPHAER